MTAMLTEASRRDCLDIVLRVVAYFTERDAKRGWLAYNEVRR